MEIKMVGMLKWWFIFICTLLGISASFLTGYAQALWSLVGSLPSFILVGIFLLVSVFIGRCTYAAVKGDKSVFDNHKRYLNYLPDLMTQLGLIGTVIGFVIMLNSFRLTADLQTMLLSQEFALKAACVALTNTAIGLVACVVLTFQKINLENACGE
jgi:hypothetical protein